MTFTELRKNEHRDDSVRKAARKIGISKSAFFHYEIGDRFPRKETLKKIQKTYDLTNEQIAKLFLNYYLN